MKTSKHLPTLLQLAAVCLLPHIGTAAVYNLSQDFSLVNNPTGPWTYGASTSLGGPLTVYQLRQSSTAGNGVAVEYWLVQLLNEPNIMFNNTTSTAISSGGQGVFPPGSVTHFPGHDSSPYTFGVVRFTAPETGNYLLETTAQTYLMGSSSGDTDYHVLVDSLSEVFGQFMPGSSSTGYTNILNLGAGHTLDFAVGRGLDGDGNFSGAILNITLTLVPEPSTAALVGVGIVGVLLRRRRK